MALIATATAHNQRAGALAAYSQPTCSLPSLVLYCIHNPFVLFIRILPHFEKPVLGQTGFV